MRISVYFTMLSQIAKQSEVKTEIFRIYRQKWLSVQNDQLVY